MRVLTAPLVGNPHPEHVKVTELMDGLRVGLARAQLFRVHANTMEEAIQIALLEEYSHRQARTPATAWQGNSAPGSAQGGSPGDGAMSGPVPMELGLAEQRDIRYFGCRRPGHMKPVCRARGQQTTFFGTSSGSKGRDQQPRPKSQGNSHGSLAEVPRVLMDLSAKFEDFDSTERFIVLEMDKYDLILGMPWLEKHEPEIDWRGKAIGDSRSAVSDGALVSHDQPLSRARASVMTARPVDPDTASCRAARGLTDNVLHAASQVGNLVPPEQGISRREPSVGTVVPRGVRKALITWKAGDTVSNVGNIVPRESVKAKQEGKVGEYTYSEGTIVPHKASLVPDKAILSDDVRDEASSDVGNIVPRRSRRRRRRHRKSGLQSQTGSSLGDSEPKAKAPQTRSPDGHYHVIDSETGLRVKADAVKLEALPEVAELLNLEEMSLDDFLAALTTGEIA
ncbi:unnamed protein product [Phytophthora fragariaefolia]|uniref:Unnamed protein product n=1 Tax=Phytophthora fragariaefolia TaxID=1490495 RepID=A0A9W6XU97_9STRA|nr:unnamed protein product [Phytophthora fragariaefolia]